MNGHLLKRSLAVVMILLGASSNARAQSASIRVVGNYGCAVNPGFQIVSVSCFSAGPVATARFKVVPSSPVTIFSPANGEFDLSFSPCVTNAGLGTLLVSNPQAYPVTFSIVPLTGHTKIEMTDCDGYDLHPVPDCGLAQLLGPYRPDPPTGAVNVPTNQLLSYVGTADLVEMSTNPKFHLGDPTNVIICNTIPPGHDSGPPCPLPLNPGTLAPHTTYYWQAASRCLCGQVSWGYSEVFSFTTGDGTLAVEATTWGRIKQMYRNQ
jgi:hypothetical protein